MIIKLFLLASLAVAGAWLVRGRRSGSKIALIRLTGLLVAVAWVIGVVFPDTVTWAAHRVGVREAPSLVLYVLVVVFTFTTIWARLTVRELEDRVATLARAHALLVERLDAEGPRPDVASVAGPER